MVSSALNRKFCDSQPTLLKASVMPTPVSPVEVAASMLASMVEVFSALTSTLRPALTVLPARRASARLSTTLVTIWPLTASTVPSPRKLPPEASTVLVAVAWINAVSSARTATSVPAVTVAWVIDASTSLRTSFMTTRMPTAVALDSVRLPRPG